MRVARTTKAESSARVLPRLPLTVPMETKLRQLLPQCGGGLLLELNPNPLADYLGEIKQVGINCVQQGQNLIGGQCPVSLPCFRINRQTRVLLLCLRLRCLRLRHY